MAIFAIVIISFSTLYISRGKNQTSNLKIYIINTVTKMWSGKNQTSNLKVYIISTILIEGSLSIIILKTFSYIKLII